MCWSVEFLLKVRFLLDKNALVVREVNLNHQNHRSDKITYDTYPENLRLNAKQTREAKKMVHLGVKKTLLKSYFMKKGKTVTLKALHNLQTKEQNLYKQPDESNELHHLLEELQKIPNARIRVYTSDNGELIGKL